MPPLFRHSADTAPVAAVAEALRNEGQSCSCTRTQPRKGSNRGEVAVCRRPLSVVDFTPIFVKKRSFSIGTFFDLSFFCQKITLLRPKNATFVKILSKWHKTDACRKIFVSLHQNTNERKRDFCHDCHTLPRLLPTFIYVPLRPIIKYWVPFLLIKFIQNLGSAWQNT